MGYTLTSFARSTRYYCFYQFFESLRGQLPEYLDTTYIQRLKPAIPRKSQLYLGSTSDCLSKTTIKQERSLPSVPFFFF